MEGDRHHNTVKYSVASSEGQPTPSNGSPGHAPSTEASGGPKPKYKHLSVLVKELK